MIAGMKITEIKSFHVAGSGERSYFIVRVDTDEGINGVGEAGIRHWSGAIANAVEHLSELVVGQDPFATERLWQRVFRWFTAAPSAPLISLCGA